jgi:putative Mg2+ transporter-C (MgtC) family protein
MDWSQEGVMVGQVIIALVLGSLLGWEREWRGFPAGIRTYGAIAVGSCVFGLISVYGIPGTTDPLRIASQVVVGVGFLGAGMIFRQGDVVGGLTSAATLWATASIGLAIAFKMFFIGVLTGGIIFLLLTLPRMKWWKYISHKPKNPQNSANL